MKPSTILMVPIHEPDLEPTNHDGKEGEEGEWERQSKRKTEHSHGRSEPVAGCNGLNQQQTDDRSCT